MNAIGLSNGKAGKGHVHHAAIKIKTIAKREDKGNNLVFTTKLLQLRGEFGKYCFTAGSAERNQQRLGDGSEQLPKTLAQHQIPNR